MNNKEISIPVKLDANETIEQLERIKQLIKDIKELDSNFGLSNVIETNDNTILIFNYNCITTKEYIEGVERKLTDELQCKCIVLDKRLKLNKAIQKVDYKTTTLYADGEVYKEETVQYK